MEDAKPTEGMFYVGAQEADGQLLPGSFTVFYNAVPPQAAVEILVEKIAKDIAELDLDIASGTMTFKSIASWQEFAELELDDHIKTSALVEAITSSAAIILYNVKQDISNALHARWCHSE
jgi:hypothetical protein